MNDKLKTLNDQLLKINDEINNELNELENVNEIIIYKKNILSIIAYYRSKIDEMNIILDIVDKKLYLQCNHKWKRDNTYYGEHSQYICSECKLYK